MDLKRLLPQPRKALTKEQQAAFVLVLFLGFGGLVLGFLSFGANIRRPFDLQIAKYTGDQYLTSAQKDEAEQAAMRARDTDEDGLTDYDETYVFKTSAYLADSDSDGRDDKLEVFSGANPNCPEGKDCGQVVATSSEVTGDDGVTVEDLVGGPFGQNLPSDIPTTDIQSEADLMTFLETMSPDEIRSALLSSGVPQATLDTINDETLKQFFLEAVHQVQTNAPSSAESSTPTSP